MPAGKRAGLLSVWRDVEISHWWCCCSGEPGDCLIYADNFEDCTSDLSYGWVEVSGDWEVTCDAGCPCTGEEMYLKSGGNNSVIRTIERSTTTAQVVSACPLKIAGSRPRIILCYNTTDGSYLYVELDPDNNTIGFGSSTTGVTITQPFSWTDGDTIVAFASAPESGKCTLSAGIDGVCRASDPYFACMGGGTGRYSGLGNGSATPARFAGTPGQFAFIEHTDTITPCGDCDCECEQSCVPPELTMTLTPDASNPECCAVGFERALTWDSDGSALHDECRWQAEGIDACGYNLDIDLIRLGPNLEDFVLQDVGWPASTPNMQPLEGSTCSPLSLLYETVVEYPGMDRCVWTITITE